MQFKIFKDENLVQGISNISFGSINPNKNKSFSSKKAIKFLNSINYRGVTEDNLVWAKQIFSPDVRLCKFEDSGKIIQNVDGFISNIPGQILTITTADCVPILLYDPENGAVGIIHGGRECLVKGVIEFAVKKMMTSFRSSPRKILVGIGPHIRVCHYWLKDKDLNYLKNTEFKKYFVPQGNRIYFNLTSIVFDKLQGLGIQKKNIEDCKVCTFEKYKKYFSRRKEEKSPNIYQEKRPCFASFIGLKIKQLKAATEIYKTIIEQGSKAIERGKVIVIPTDTIYGLIADACNEKAVMKIFRIKERPESKVLPIFVKDIKMAKQFAKIDKRQEKFLRKYWPGKVTVVLERKGRKKIYGVDKKTIGLRVPDSKIINAIISKIKKPLVQTSVNISGQPPINDAEKVLSVFSGRKYKPDLIIDGGPIKEGLQSTLVDLTGKELKILREGSIKIKWNAKI